MIEPGGRTSLNEAKGQIGKPSLKKGPGFLLHFHGTIKYAFITRAEPQMQAQEHTFGRVHKMSFQAPDMYLQNM